MKTISKSAEVLERNQSFYDRNAEAYCRTAEALDMTPYYARLARHLRSGARVLDAGCGSGRDSLVFGQSPFSFRVTAIDASVEMVRRAQARGVAAKQMTLQEMRWTGTFDGIWASASLLHVPHNEISTVLVRFRRALKPGGVIFISLKRGTSEALAADGRFFSYFSPEEFRSELNVADFEILEEWTSAEDVGLHPWMQFVARRPV